MKTSNRPRLRAISRNDFIGHNKALLITSRPQAIDHPVPVRWHPVLADLPLAFQPLDRNFDANNALQLLAYEIFWRVLDAPALCQPRLMLLRKGAHVAQQEVRIFVSPQ